MKPYGLLTLSFLLILAFQPSICLADSDTTQSSHISGGFLTNMTFIQEIYVGARMGSYKPDLGELDSLLGQLGIDAPGSSTMYNVFCRLKSSPHLSYLLEIGRWENDVSVELVDPISIGANLTYASLILLYYPEMIQKYAPLYLGLGGGFANVELTGSALDLLSDIITEREGTGPCGNFVVGLEYMILERMMINVQANHIFKKFAIDKQEEQKFTFDGTTVSIGISGRF